MSLTNTLGCTRLRQRLTAGSPVWSSTAQRWPQCAARRVLLKNLCCSSLCSSSFSSSKPGGTSKSISFGFPPFHLGSTRQWQLQAQSRDGGQRESDPGKQSSEIAIAEPTTRQHNWGELTLWLFLAGFFLGAPLDGLHSVVGLQVYDGPAAITIGSPVDGLLTSLWVPPLLGAMYVVVGLLQVWIDDTWRPSERVPAYRGSRRQMLTSLALLIGLLRLSSLLYENNFSSTFILGVLLVFANGSWYCFDRTIPGYALAVVVGLGAPLCEVLCLKLGMWHYSTPDVFIAEEGLVSWTTCCYFFYTQWVASVARALDSVLSPVASSSGGESKQKNE